jgi:hypothetical protein
MARRIGSSSSKRVFSARALIPLRGLRSVVGVVACAAGASAAPAPEPIAEAQRLFDEARALMQDSRFSEACPKLAESQRLDPGGGTLLNLGICHEKEGRTATAFRELNEALLQARRDGREDREKTAGKHLSAVTPLLSHLSVRLSSTPPQPGLVVRVDGAELSPSDLGAARPVDPGDHEITATAPGRRAWSAHVQIQAKSDLQTVDVPELEPAEAAAPAAAPPPSSRRSHHPSTPVARLNPPFRRERNGKRLPTPCGPWATSRAGSESRRSESARISG